MREGEINSHLFDYGEIGRNKGLIYYGDDGEDAVWLCETIEMTALCKDSEGYWGLQLEWVDHSGMPVIWKMPAHYLIAGKRLLMEFLSRGLRISADKKARKLLLYWLNVQRPTDLRFVSDEFFRPEKFYKEELPNEIDKSDASTNPFPWLKN